MSDTLAARMRAKYVGDDAIAFDELKPEVRARWERVAAVSPAPIRVPFSDAQIERMAKAMQPIVYEDTKWHIIHESAKTALRRGIRAALAAGGLVPCAVPERASDEELGEVLRRELGMEGLPRPVRAAAAIRARVEAPALAEIQRLEIENRDRAFYVEQFAAVSQERDALKSDLAAIFEIAAQDDADTALEAVKKLSEYADTIEWGEARTDSAHKSLLAERDTLKARVAELEASKAGWCERDRGNMLLEMSGLREQLAALRQPVAPDAWKTPLELRYADRQSVVLEGRDGGFYVTIKANGMAQGNVSFLPPADAARAARAAQWLASYAAAHGCPVGPLAIEPIASPDVLEQLAEIAERAYEADETNNMREAFCSVVAAILRAAQAYVDVEPRTQYITDGGGSLWFMNQSAINYLNSRIRYCVALPDTPNAQMQRCIDRKNKRIDTLKAIAKKWKAKATETPKGLPSVEELAMGIDWKSFYCNATSGKPCTLGCDKAREFVAQHILTALRPWLREPTGWELDVTEDEASAAWRQHESPDYKLSMQAVIDLCRSRIRPTFECAECAKVKAERDAFCRSWDDCRNRLCVIRNLCAALEGE